VTLSIPKGERNWEYKAYLKEVFENVYSTKEAFGRFGNWVVIDLWYAC